MDFSIDLGNVSWETVIVSGATAFIAALVASVTAMRVYKRQRRHDLEDRWAEIRAEIIQGPLPDALETLRAHVPADATAPSWDRKAAVADAQRQIDSVGRASSGLPAGERKKYITPLRRRVAKMVTLDHELESANAASPHDSVAKPELDATQWDAITRLEGDLVATFQVLVDGLESFDEHLQTKAATGQGLRWFRL